jgi:hypothetical protein
VVVGIVVAVVVDSVVRVVHSTLALQVNICVEGILSHSEVVLSFAPMRT